MSVQLTRGGGLVIANWKQHVLFGGRLEYRTILMFVMYTLRCILLHNDIWPLKCDDELIIRRYIKDAINFSQGYSFYFILIFFIYGGLEIEVRVLSTVFVVWIFS